MEYGHLKILSGIELILDDQGNHLDSYTISLESFMSFRGPLFPKPVTGQELFSSFSYSKPALEKSAPCSLVTVLLLIRLILWWSDLLFDQLSIPAVSFSMGTGNFYHDVIPIPMFSTVHLCVLWVSHWRQSLFDLALIKSCLLNLFSFNWISHWLKFKSG